MICNQRCSGSEAIAPFSLVSRQLCLQVATRCTRGVRVVFSEEECDLAVVFIYE